jgi:uncharacterized SAM-binding protein YcdF (DUF218 family)
MPLGFGLLIILIGLYFLYRNSYTKAKLFITAGFVWILLFSYSPIANTLLHTVEEIPVENTWTNEPITHVLLLGGDFETRAYRVLELYEENPNLIIITSGYEGSYPEPKAYHSRDKLLKLGVKASHIITLPKPKDTHDEALAIKELLGTKPFYLVTSAYHMPRAHALFTKVGTNPIAMSASPLEDANKYFRINGHEISKSETAFHEYLGLLWSYLKGDI